MASEGSIEDGIREGRIVFQSCQLSLGRSISSDDEAKGDDANSPSVAPKPAADVDEPAFDGSSGNDKQHGGSNRTAESEHLTSSCNDGEPADHPDDESTLNAFSFDLTVDLSLSVDEDASCVVTVVVVPAVHGCLFLSLLVV